MSGNASYSCSIGVFFGILLAITVLQPSCYHDALPRQLSRAVFESDGGATASLHLHIRPATEQSSKISHPSRAEAVQAYGKISSVLPHSGDLGNQEDFIPGDQRNLAVTCLQLPCETSPEPPLLGAFLSAKGTIGHLRLPWNLPVGSEAQPHTAQMLIVQGSPLEAHGTQMAPQLPGHPDVLSMTGRSDLCAWLRTQHPPLHKPYWKQRRVIGSNVLIPYTLCSETVSSKQRKGEQASETQPEFTLVTHTDLRVFQTAAVKQQQAGAAWDLRALRVLRLASRWNGAISIGARLLWGEKEPTDASVVPSRADPLVNQRSRLRLLLEKHLLSRLSPHDAYLLASVDIHLVSYPGTYSQNVGRNAALRCARTKFVLVIDADFVPPVGTADILAKRYAGTLCSKPSALVLPHFDVFNKTAEDRRSNKNRAFVLSGNEPSASYVYDICSTKDGLRAGVKGRNITRFHEYNAPHTLCHDSNHWLRSSTPYRISSDYLRSGCPTLWEPVLAFHANRLMPYFPEVFAGRGFDRVSHVMQLRWLSYDFIVDNDLFLCHPAERHNYTAGDSHDEKWNTAYYHKIWKGKTQQRFSDPKLLKARDTAFRDGQIACEADANRRLAAVEDSGLCTAQFAVGEAAQHEPSYMASTGAPASNRRPQIVARTWQC